MSDDPDNELVRKDAYSNGLPPLDRPKRGERPASPAPMRANPLTPQKVAEIEKAVERARAAGEIPPLSKPR